MTESEDGTALEDEGCTPECLATLQEEGFLFLEGEGWIAICGGGECGGC